MVTGPQSAVEGSKYKYVEVSSPRSSNDIARLESSTNLNAGDYCLTFQYHMFGLDTMGDLKISTGVTAPENEVFIESGNLGDQWNKGMVTISNAAGMKLFIEANKGTNWDGDIAIDDIQLMLGVCAGGLRLGDIAIDDIQLMPGVCACGMLIIRLGLGYGDIAIDDIQLMPGVCAGGMLFIVVRVRVRVRDIAIDDIQLMPERVLVVLVNCQVRLGDIAIDDIQLMPECDGGLGWGDIAIDDIQLMPECAGSMLIIVVRVKWLGLGLGDIAIDDIQLMPGACAGSMLIIVVRVRLGDIAIDDIQLMPGVCAGACASGMIIVVRVRVRGDIAIDDIQLMPGVCAGGMLIIVVRVRLGDIAIDDITTNAWSVCCWLGLGDIAIDDIQLMPGACAGGCSNYPCVLGTCSGPVNSATYTCTCNPGVTGTNCDQLTDKERPEPVGESTPPLQYNRLDMDSMLTIEENVLEVDGPGSPSLLDKAECVQDRNSPNPSNNSNGANITSSEKCDNMPQKKIDFIEECEQCNLTLTNALHQHGSSNS
ncbi:unnamed protein product [Mytilus edulis]|uniref:Uncharacterized protein n=1 Tax=Mytilus edulis TaxID=6550 RepID=A0A8S3TBE9_MYTED|nr:unnamed protein product [Mytilus edulis]